MTHQNGYTNHHDDYPRLRNPIPCWTTDWLAVFERLSGYNEESKIKFLVAVVVTMGWISATMAGILIASYTVSPLLHALMGAIVGYFFTDDGLTFNIGGDK